MSDHPNLLNWQPSISKSLVVLSAGKKLAFAQDSARGSNRRDELMPEIRDILDEVFSLMQQQMRARPNNTSATETEEYKRRAERIEHLLGYLIREGPHRRSKEMPYD
jgi:hypothetical protein